MAEKMRSLQLERKKTKPRTKKYFTTHRDNVPDGDIISY